MTAPVRSPWVRTRLRSAPLASLLAVVLAFGAVFLAAALPRALDRSADQGLQAYLRRADPSATQLQVYARPQVMDSAGRAQDLDHALSVLRQQLGPDLPLDARDAAYGEQGRVPRELPDPGLARPDGLDPQLHLLYLAHVTDHVRLVSGRWPDAPPGSGVVQIALARDAARTLGVRLGQVLHSVPLADTAMSVQVVGLYTADDPTDRFWAGLSCATGACREQAPGGAPPPTFWSATALVGQDSVAAIGPWSGLQAQDFWRLPVDSARLRDNRLADSRSAVASWLNGPSAQAATDATGRPELSVSSGLLDLFDQVAARQAAIQPLTAVGPAGLAGVVVVVLCLAAGLTAERRATELHLLLARGGSRKDLLLRLLGEGACTVLPAGALATALALVLLPTTNWLTAVLAALGAALLALLAVPVRTLARDALGLRTGPRRRGRRLVAELVLLAAAVAAVLEVRRRGVSGLDPLLIAAPLLLATVGAVVLARCQPLVVGALARAAARGSGAVGFLGLTRAASGAGDRRRASMLPLLALTLAVTTAGFGAATLRTVADSRGTAARLAVGGDASVTAPSGTTLAPSVIRALAALPGLSLGTPFWEQDDVTVQTEGATPVHATVVAVDPADYARLARSIGRGSFDPALLTTRPTGAAAQVPALVSADLASSAGPHRPFRLLLDDNSELQVTGVGVVAGTPAVIAPAASVVVVPAGARLPGTGHPNRWLGLGSVSETRLRASVPSDYLVDAGSAHLAALADDPLQATATGLFWDCTVATWCFAVLAVLLALLRAGPERAALLARLRTMGLRPRQGLRLILAEAMPQTLAAALGGGLTAAAAVLLLGPTVDLSPLVGASVPTGVSLTAPPILGQTLIVAGLVALAVLVEAAVQGRRQITIELRAGDGR
ncbi:putative ABC transport system permease protein [Streptacidiphilus sp. MAP12-16]|uniref:hypothetical protein n=1 Tax=Streptacidiphilus sp. MAP12-16 TaxID=3156300 RepID=UPI003514BF6A